MELRERMGTSLRRMVKEGDYGSMGEGRATRSDRQSGHVDEDGEQPQEDGEG